MLKPFPLDKNSVISTCVQTWRWLWRSHSIPTIEITCFCCLSSSKIHYTVKTAFGKRTHWGCSLIRLFRLSTPLIVFPCQWTWIHTVLSSHSNQPFAVGCDAWSMSSSALYFSSILYILRFRSLPPHPLSPSGSQMKNWRNIVLTISHNPK